MGDAKDLAASKNRRVASAIFTIQMLLGVGILLLGFLATPAGLTSTIIQTVGVVVMILAAGEMCFWQHAHPTGTDENPDNTASSPHNNPAFDRYWWQGPKPVTVELTDSQLRRL